MRCILHIGAAKTGTTSLQAFLAQNRERLQQQGIYYPGPEPAQHFLALPYLGAQFNYAKQQGLRTPEAIQKHFRDCWNAARIAQPLAGTQTLLLSSEALFTVQLQHWMELKTQIESNYSRIQLVVYLRRPDQWAQSFWISRHRDGGIPEFDPPPWFARTPIQRCLEVFGAEELEIRLFDREKLIGGDIRDDFAHWLGLETSDWVRPPLANESNSLEQLQLLRRLNRWLETHHPAWQFSPLRYRLQASIDQQPHHTPVRFSRAECAALLEQYREDLDWIEQLTSAQGRPLAFDRRTDHLPVEGTWRRVDDAPPSELLEQVLWQVIETFAFQPNSAPPRRLQVTDLAILEACDAAQLKSTPPTLGRWQRPIPPAPKVEVTLDDLDGLLAADVAHLQSFPGFATAWPRLTQDSQTIYTVPRFLFRGSTQSTLWAQSADGVVIEELPYRGKLHRQRSLHDLQQEPQLSQQQQPFPDVDQELFVIPGIQDLGYYHFLVNSLPTLTWYRQLGLDGPIYFPPNILKRFPVYARILRAVFAWLGIPEDRLLDVASTVPATYRRAYIPAPIGRYDAHVGQFHQDLAAHLLQRETTTDSPVTNAKRLYLSRGDAARRPLVNEAELIEALLQQGFHCVELSRLAFAAQVALMHHAELIVAPHGAGLVNLGFCRPGAVVVELLTIPTALVYLRPAAFKGLHYFPLTCTLAPGCDPAPDQLNSPHSRWQVDIHRLLRVLERIDLLPRKPSQRNATSCYDLSRSSINLAGDIERVAIEDSPEKHIEHQLRMISNAQGNHAALIEIIEHWLSHAGAQDSECNRIESLRQSVAEKPAQLTALRRWAQEQRLAACHEQAEIAYEIVLILSPNQLQSYKDVALQRHIETQKSTLDLFDALLAWRSQGSVSLARLRRRFAEAGIHRYAVPLAPSGLGDQLFIAATTARFSELLGLTFQGIAVLSKNVSGFSGRLFQDPNHAQRAMGIAALQRLDQADVWTPFSLVNIDPGAKFLAFIDALCTLSTQPLPKSVILCFEMVFHVYDSLSMFLSDRQDNVFSNGFSRCLRRHCQQSVSLPKRTTHPVFLMHLRLGDTANIHGLVDNHVFIPHGMQLISNSKINQHPRYNPWQQWVHLAQALRKQFDQRIRLILMSDGLDRTFAILRDPNKKRHYDRLGIHLTESKLDDIEQRMRQKLNDDFSNLFDVCLIGEDEQAFDQSLMHIGAADFCISSSGHFVIQVANILRYSDHRPLTYYRFHHNKRSLITRQEIKTVFLHDDIKTAITEIVIDVNQKISGSTCAI